MPVYTSSFGTDFRVINAVLKGFYYNAETGERYTEKLKK